MSKKHTYKDDRDLIFGVLKVGKVSITITGEENAVIGTEAEVTKALTAIKRSAEKLYQDKAPQQVMALGEPTAVKRPRKAKAEQPEAAPEGEATSGA